MPTVLSQDENLSNNQRESSDELLQLESTYSDGIKGTWDIVFGQSLVVSLESG